MRFIISAMAGALALAACTVQPPPQKPAAPVPAPQVATPAPSPATVTDRVRKKRKDVAKDSRQDKKQARSKTKQIRAVVTKGEVPDCGLVRWAANSFSEERLKSLERTASAEQKKHAKACLDGRG